MAWLTPAVISTLAGSLILTFIYAFLYFKEKQRFLSIWAISWLIYSLRYVFILIGFRLGDQPYKAIRLIRERAPRSLRHLYSSRPHNVAPSRRKSLTFLLLWAGKPSQTIKSLPGICCSKCFRKRTMLDPSNNSSCVMAYSLPLGVIALITDTCSQKRCRNTGVSPRGA